MYTIVHTIVYTIIYVPHNLSWKFDIIKFGAVMYQRSVFTVRDRAYIMSGTTLSYDTVKIYIYT